MNPAGYASYHAASLEARTASASPVQLVIVLMDGLLDEMARARSHLENRRYEAKGKSINRCIDMLTGLKSTLDFDSGSEVVTNLARLYDYCAWRLNEAGCALDPALIDEVAALVTTLRDAWQGVEARHR
jgi:flagellar secretion chaperone FliS